MEKISYRDEEKTLSKVAATLHFALDKRLQSSKSRWKDREEGKNKIRFWQCSGRLELIWHTGPARRSSHSWSDAIFQFLYARHFPFSKREIALSGEKRWDLPKFFSRKYLFLKSHSKILLLRGFFFAFTGEWKRETERRHKFGFCQKMIDQPFPEFLYEAMYQAERDSENWQ